MKPFLAAQSQAISGAVEIGAEWQEISAAELLKASQPRHYVWLETGQIETFDSRDPEHQTVVFKNGQRGKIEAFLFDDQGESYELMVGMTGGGIGLSRKLPPRATVEPPQTEPDFPLGRTYTKLKIRSSLPIHCDKITWIGSTPK